MSFEGWPPIGGREHPALYAFRGRCVSPIHRAGCSFLPARWVRFSVLAVGYVDHYLANWPVIQCLDVMMLDVFESCGHDKNPANIRWDGGFRRCRTCRNRAAREARQRERDAYRASRNNVDGAAGPRN